MNASFFHSKTAQQASYRYRGAIPARELGWPMNDETADIWIVSKIDKGTPAFIERGHAMGKRVVVDVCDLHLALSWYQEAILHADHVTVPTEFAADVIAADFGAPVSVIPDPYECPEREPHVRGLHLFWFGHAQNFYSLEPWLPALKPYTLRVMSNIEGAIPWSFDRLQEELAWADVVLIPETAPYKSPNRAVEAIRQGCFVVAEPHPGLADIPGLWTGHLLKGIQWVEQHQTEANARVTQAQTYVRERFSPARVANAWRTCIQACASNWGVDISPGTDGSTWTASAPVTAPMSSAT